MKRRVFSIFIISLILQSCFVLDKSITWEDESKLNKTYGCDSTDIEIKMTIVRSPKFIPLPFIFLSIHKKRPIYNPQIYTYFNKKDSLISLTDFRFELLKNDSVFFSQNYSDTIKLSELNGNGDFIGVFGKKVLIPKLNKVEDSILINYSFKTIDYRENVKEYQFKNVNYIRSKSKSFFFFTSMM
jgi:hypothetical protein